MLDGFVVIFTATMNCGKGGIGYCADCKSAPLNAFHLPLAAGPLQNLLYNKELMNQPLLSYIPEVRKQGLRLRCCKTKRCRASSTSHCLVWSCGKGGIDYCADCKSAPLNAFHLTLAAGALARLVLRQGVDKSTTFVFRLHALQTSLCA